MDKQALARQLVATLGETLTIPGGLHLDEATSSAVLLFDGDLIVNIEYDDPAGRLVLSAYLGELPQAGAEPLLRELMAANLYTHRTRGATLALEEGTDGVILTWGGSATELDDISFEIAVENFVNQVQHWHGRVEAAQSPGRTTDAPDPRASPMGGAGFIYG